MPQIRGIQGRSRSILLRALGNEGGGVLSAFPQGKQNGIFLKILYLIDKSIMNITSEPTKHANDQTLKICFPFCLRSIRVRFYIAILLTCSCMALLGVTPSAAETAKDLYFQAQASYNALNKDPPNRNIGTIGCPVSTSLRRFTNMTPPGPGRLPVSI